MNTTVKFLTLFVIGLISGLFMPIVIWDSTVMLIEILFRQFSLITLGLVMLAGMMGFLIGWGIHSLIRKSTKGKI